MYNMLKGKNEGLRKDVLSFAEKLVKEPSMSLNEEKTAELIEVEMKKIGYDKVVRDNAGNVIGILFGKYQKPTVLLCSHMDTISADYNEKEGIREGRLYGRGASDCKGGLAAQVYSCALLKRSLLPMEGNVVVAATVAEENGFSIGTRLLMRETLPELGLKPDFAILGEPTGLGIFHGHDGWMEMDVTVKGKSRNNAVNAAGMVTNEIMNDYMEFKNGEYEILTPVISENHGESEAVIRFRRKLNSLEEPDTIVNRMQRRTMTATKTLDKVAVNVLLTMKKQKLYTGREVSPEFAVKAWETNLYDPMVERARQSLEAAGCAVNIGKWKLEHIGMGTAGGVLLKEYGVQTIGYGPGLEEEAHSPRECVELEKISEAVYGTAVITHAIAGIPVCGWTLDEI